MLANHFDQFVVWLANYVPNCLNCFSVRFVGRPGIPRSSNPHSEREQNAEGENAKAQDTKQNHVKKTIHHEVLNPIADCVALWKN
jgi:hypothetical protein